MVCNVPRDQRPAPLENAGLSRITTPCPASAGSIGVCPPRAQTFCYGLVFRAVSILLRRALK